MKLLGSNKSKITKDKNGENVPYLKTTEVVLLHCNTVIFLKIFDSESSYIEVSFNDQDS